MGSKIVAVLVALSISGSVAWAATTGPPYHKPPKGHGHGYPGGKVKLCHKPWKKHGGTTIWVSERSVRKHLRHGDRFGRCRRH